MEQRLAENDINVGDRVRFHSGTDPGCWMEGVIVSGWRPDPNPSANGNRVSMRVEASAGTWARSNKGAPTVGDVRHPNPCHGGYFVRVVVDPLDVKYDGLTLRQLLDCRTLADQEGCRITLTPAQRAAVSAHWSAQLRAKVAASAERDRRRVLADIDES